MCFPSAKMGLERYRGSAAAFYATSACAVRLASHDNNRRAAIKSREIFASVRQRRQQQQLAAAMMMMMVREGEMFSRFVRVRRRIWAKTAAS